MPDTITFPSTLPVATLKKSNPAFDADAIKKHDALYRAGHAFKECVDQFLVKRQIEKAQTAVVNGANHYEQRKEKAWYIPRASGIIDWLVAEVFKRDLRIIVGDGASEQGRTYWESLNDNADGLGTNLAAIARQTLRDVLLHGGGWYSLNFDADIATATDASSKDARIRRLPAKHVDDWNYDHRGQLKFARVAWCEMARTNPAEIWTPATNELHRWVYYTPGAIAEFNAVKEEGKDLANEARKVRDDKNDFPSLPVFPVRVDCGLHVMERISEPSIALFNREVSLTWALDQLAYAMLVLKTDITDLNTIIATEIAALKLKPTEGADFISPPPGIFEPLFKDTERLKAALYEVIQAMSLQAAATQTQNARQSAAAKAIDRDPLRTLLASFAWPVKDSLQALVNELKKYRGEDFDVWVEGGDEFDASSEDLKEQIKGTDVSEPEVKEAVPIEE